MSRLPGELQESSSWTNCGPDYTAPLCLGGGALVFSLEAILSPGFCMLFIRYINIYLSLCMGLRIHLKYSNGCSRGISMDRSPWRRSPGEGWALRCVPVPHGDGPDCNSLVLALMSNLSKGTNCTHTASLSLAATACGLVL